MRRIHTWLGLLLLVGVFVLDIRARDHAQPGTGRQPRERPPAAEPEAKAAPEALRTAGDRPLEVKSIRLDLKVDIPRKIAEGRATLSVHSLRRLSSVTLDAMEFEVRGVALLQDKKDPVTLRFGHDGKKLSIDFEPALPADADATLRIDYRVCEPRAGLHFFGPTRAEPDTPLTVWSQGEPISNRYWIPCLDQPNQRQSTELVVTVVEGFEVLSNGALIEKKDNGDKTVTFHWKQEKPHPSYLVTLVVGQFDIVQEEWNKVPVLYYVPKGRKPDVARTFGRTREMLEYFSKRFGVDYPWDKYAQVVVEQFTSGGMENTSATTLTERALHDERAFLDSSPDSLIAHELAHQWWGDMVTCRDWSHLWLNEGFASYAEALWDEHKKGRDDYAYTILVKSRTALAGTKERPVVDRRYPFPRDMFDARSYPKGAFVLHMLRQRLGEDAFWKGMQRYGTDHRLQSVETADFRRTHEKVSGRDLERFFYDWTERPGHPTLEIASEYNPEAKQVRVVVKQTQTAEAFHFPLKVRIGAAAPASAVVVEETVTEKEYRFSVPLTSRPTSIEIDPEQAVLAEVKETKGRDLWLAQLTGGTTISSRVRAAEYFGKSKLPGDREALVKALNEEKFWGVQVEVVKALGESGGDVCRDALIAGLKLEEPRVRRACADQLGKFVGDAKAASALNAVLTKGDASYFVEAASLSSYAKLKQENTVSVLLPWLAKNSHNDVLRTAALGGLGQAADMAGLDTLVEWTKRGKPRSCRVAALSALGKLTQTGNPNREQRDRAIKALAACLDGEDRIVRQGAIMSLRDLGQTAAPAVAALEALAQHDPDDRVADAARRAITQIRGSGSAPSELSKLREEIERLKKSQEALLERLEKFEKAERKGN
jgi:aminopeptidase N